MSIIKRIGFSAPYISETFNLKDKSIFGSDAILYGMEYEVDGATITVAPGKFISNGIVVETTNPYPVDIDPDLTTAYLVAYTDNSSGTGDDDYVIDIFTTYSTGAIVATYNGTEWLPTRRKLQVSRIANKEDEGGFIGGALNTQWSITDLNVSVVGPQAIFDDRTYFESNETYTVSLNSSSKHWTLQSVCAYEKDQIIDIDSFALGTVFEGTNCTSSTASAVTSVSKVRTLALEGEEMVTISLTSAGKLTANFYIPSSTAGTCADSGTGEIVLNTGSPNAVLDFDACVIGSYIYVAYTKNVGPKYYVYGVKVNSSNDSKSLSIPDTIGVDNLITVPKFRTDGTNLYCAWLEGTVINIATINSTFTNVTSTRAVYSDANLGNAFDFLPLKDKIVWNCLYSTAPTYLIEFETNKSGASKTANTTVDNYECARPRMGVSPWGTIYKSWIADVGGDITGKIKSLVKTPRNPAGEEFTHEFVFETANLAEARLAFSPTDADGALVLTIDRSHPVGETRHYYRIDLYGTEIYSKAIISTVTDTSNEGDVAFLKSGAACVAVVNTTGALYTAYVPTASATTGFTLPINGMELVRAETNLSNGVDLSYSPRAHKTHNGCWEPNSRVESIGIVKVILPTKGVSLEIVNPFGGIKEALAYLTTYPPDASNRAYIELGPGRYPILEPLDLTASYVEIRGNNSVIVDHALFAYGTTPYLARINGKNYIKLNDLVVKPSNQTNFVGIKVTGTCTNICIVDNFVYGNEAINVDIANVTDYVIDRNYCESYTGDPIKIG